MLNFIQESTGQAQRSDTNTFLPLGWLLHILYTENRKNESSLYKEMLKTSVFFYFSNLSESLEKTGKEAYSLREWRTGGVLPVQRTLECQQKVVPEETWAVVQGCLSSKANRSAHTELLKGATFSLAGLGRPQEVPWI